ncbi:MAG: outer membrane protein assembly factor BamA [Candidatus Aminicenantes bacterium]|nr:outer membrane protein assembly factor BamA [Candidatus Aminicenantes bacterium]
MLKFIKDFNSRGNFLLVLITLILSLRPDCAFSYAEPIPGPIVSKVIIKVDGQENGKEVAEMLAVKEGEAFSLKKISDSVRNMFKTGLFSDIQVLKTGEQNIQLTFLLTRRLFTRSIDFSGDLVIPKRELRESLNSLSRDAPFSEQRLLKAQEELKEALRREGYFQAVVSSSVETDLESYSVDVFFEVSPEERFTLKEIDFTGNILVSKERLRKQMKSREKETYVPSRIEEDITRLRELYYSLGYQQAEVEISSERFDEEDRSVFLTLKVNPYRKIEISVTGAQIPLSLLRPIWEAEIFEEWGLAEGEAKIIAHLRQKGYLFPHVNSSIRRVGNEIRVVYEVVPGERYRIQDIIFEGIKYFTPAQLKKELEIAKKIPFLIWLDGERLFELPREIEILYRTHGFPRIMIDLNFIMTGKKAKAVFFIEEGPQTTIEKISFVGNSLFTAEQLLEQIGSFETGPFFRPSIQKDLEKLETFYLNQGIRRTKITVNIDGKDDRLVNLDFVISEGKKVKVEKIVITGNRTTRRRTILKEIRIKEGDYAYYESIVDTKRRLENLGVFSEIKIEEIPVSPTKENIVINLREGERNYVSLGIGLETKSEPYIFAIWNNVIRPRGIAEFIRGNILGSATQLSLVAQASPKEKRGVLSWEQPYLLGLPWQSSLNAWIEQEERRSYSYERRGISLTAIKPATEELTLLTTLRWVRTNIFDLEIEESEVDRQNQPYSASSISGSLIWDRRDDPFNPEKGAFLSFAAEWAYPIFQAESDYLKNFIKYQQFFPLFLGFSLSSTARLGLGTGNIPIHERFFGGGSGSFRGERFDELGPKDLSTLRPVGGKALVLLNLEFTFPLLSAVKDLSGAVFYDLGNIFPEISDVKLASLQDALGFGIRYRTPLGPIRFELGWNLDAPKGERKPLVFITIGNVF